MILALIIVVIIIIAIIENNPWMVLVMIGIFLLIIQELPMVEFDYLKARDTTCHGHQHGHQHVQCHDTFMPMHPISDIRNDNEIDGDQRMARQSIQRNDPLRSTIGSMRKQCDLDKYLREELNEEEDAVWWGRDEY